MGSSLHFAMEDGLLAADFVGFGQIIDCWRLCCRRWCPRHLSSCSVSIAAGWSSGTWLGFLEYALAHGARRCCCPCSEPSLNYYLKHWYYGSIGFQTSFLTGPTLGSSDSYTIPIPMAGHWSSWYSCTLDTEDSSNTTARWWAALDHLQLDSESVTDASDWPGSAWCLLSSCSDSAESSWRALNYSWSANDSYLLK